MTPPSSGTPTPHAGRPIRVLLLEDQPLDAELIVRELTRTGFVPDWRRVESEPDFVAAIDPSLDVILADYTLPCYNGLEALRHVQQRGLDIPFIIISGSLGDELAAQCIKLGVTDYLLKDRLGRLGLAVTNALEERRLRSERKLVEAQLRQAQKMELLGQLAGGIAHDFNNMLTVINGWSSVLLEETNLPPDLQEPIKQIYATGERAAGLTRQLLVFSRKLPIQRVPLDLNHVIEQVAAMLRRLLGEPITLTLELAPAVPSIEADQSMMEQVLVNLAVNARDAMPRGGLLHISTQIVDLPAPGPLDHPESHAGRFVRLKVRDTGTGISPDHLPRLFEPFFTTKDVGKGTGVGLATIYGIVKQHHGWIEVDTVLGGGTTFTVFIPPVAALDDDPAATPEPAASSTDQGGNETILVVEDETSVRDFAVAVLRPAGYRVLQARSGVDALEVWKWHAARIDLLLTDVVMPDDVSGPELAARLQAEKPGLPAIFVSGYSHEINTLDAPLPPASRFLRKPYTPRALRQAVREILDERIASAALRPTP